MAGEVAVHIRTLRPSGATLAVVAVEDEVFGATNAEPFAALHDAAEKASAHFETRGGPADLRIILDRGHAELKRRNPVECSRRCPLCESLDTGRIPLQSPHNQDWLRADDRRMPPGQRSVSVRDSV